MTLSFYKLTGAGNDFVAFDNRDGQLPPEGEERAGLIRKLCARRVGVGADGVLLIEPPEGEADFRMRYYNSDGGEAETCGNGARCIARFANLLGIVGDTATFETQAGPYRAIIRPDAVRVSMGDVTGLELDVAVEAGDAFSGTLDFANSGVPHAVIETDDLEDAKVVAIGRAVRYCDRFAPAGTNVNFIARTGENRLAIRTYERGVEDETLACGTGCIASAVIAARRGRVASPVILATRSGVELTVHFAPTESGATHVELEGEARLVYTAQLAD